MSARNSHSVTTFFRTYFETSLFRHFVQMVSWNGLTILIGIITNVCLARFLGPEDRGELAIIVLSVSLASVVLNLGYAEGTIFVVGAKLFRIEEIVSTLVCYFGAIFLLLSIPFFLLLNSVLYFGVAESLILLLATAAVSINSVFRHVVIGQKRFQTYSVSVAIEGLVYLLAIVFFWRLRLPSVSNILVGFTVAAVLVTVAMASLFFKYFSLEHVRIRVVIRTLKHGIHLFIAGLGGFAVQRISYFLLEMISGTRSVGFYTASNTIPALFRNLPQQLSIVLYSHVSATGDVDEGARVTDKAIKYVIVLSAVFILPVAIFSEDLVLFLFGEQFSGIGSTMVILAFAQIFLGLGNLFLNALAGLSMSKFGTNMTLINLFGTGIIGYLLIPRYELLGAAAAQLICGLVSTLYVGQVYFKKIGKAPKV